MTSRSKTATIAVVVMCFYVKASTSEDYGYGTKTPYKPGNLQLVPSPPGCHAVHLNMLLRHGSRYPSGGNKDKIAALLTKIDKAHSTKFTYKNLTLPWSQPNNYNIAKGSELSPAGEQEAYLLGKRFRVRFQALFTRKYWNRYYEFLTTDKQRTARTASAFSYGIFEGNGTLGNAKYQPIAIKFSGPKDNDKLLRYHAACPKYDKEIEDGTGLDELKKFGVGTEMKRVISNIEERLQLKGKINLTAEDAKDLFMLCAFATLNHETREWCSLFTDNDIKVFEYQSDLDNYYTHSYGNEFSYNTSCPLLGDVINTLNKFVKESVPYGIFRFAHSSTMVALQSILGMYKDPYKLMADNFEQSTNRTFRISRNVPMAANLAFVLYRCGKEFKVQVLMNERPAALPCCNGQSVCALKTFMSCYEDIGKNCDFEAMCKLSAHTASSTNLRTSVWWLTVVLVALRAL